MNQKADTNYLVRLLKTNMTLKEFRKKRGLFNHNSQKIINMKSPQCLKMGKYHINIELKVKIFKINFNSRKGLLVLLGGFIKNNKILMVEKSFERNLKKLKGLLKKERSSEKLNNSMR